MKMDRRMFLRAAAAAGVGAMLRPPGSLWAQTPTNRMARFPEKTDLILVTDRPPQLETPISYFKQDLTPNDAFFVRWHLSAIPTSVDLKTFRLSVGGHVDRAMTFSVDQLKRQFEPVSLVAVAQCSGNSRSFFEPRVTGGQWGNGAVGNAKWTGVRLRDLLAKAGVRAGAVDVSFAGLDEPPMPDMPKFVKSLDLAHANDGEVMVAYAMNEAPLPMLNGFPLRLVVPGWFGTYWVKSLNQINVLNAKFSGFWMDKAYRIPANPDAAEVPGKLATETIPINRHTVRSLFVTPAAGETVRAEKTLQVEGVAFDDGHGIAKVEISFDGGKSWVDAKLENDLGKYSWRRWRVGWKPPVPGKYSLMARATNNAGATQVAEQHWNRSGYQRNIIEKMEIEVSA
jgi:DMSO/TMAO reductase YedYZ molybdopterin-dependent catalytic subunit